MGQIIGRYYKPYKIRIEGHNDPLILKALTMIDLDTGWFEIVSYNEKQAAMSHSASIRVLLIG